MPPSQQPAGVKYDCPFEKGFERQQKIGSSKVQLLPGDKDDGKDKDKDNQARCRAAVYWQGKTVTVANDWALTLDKISGSDINGDGKPELVLDGYSGGAHCCYTYRIVTLQGTPRVLQSLSSERPMTFEKQKDGTTLIRADDGVFDYFLLPHAQAVIPQLFLTMQGEKLVNVSSQFSEQYDAQIQKARQELTASDLEKFRSSRFSDRMFTDQVPTVHRVLVIVLNYLYSGRETEAWKALAELWPESDQARVKALILERHSRGLLSSLNSQYPQRARQGAGNKTP